LCDLRWLECKNGKHEWRLFNKHYYAKWTG
jgi:hypothetical protein